MTVSKGTLAHLLTTHAIFPFLVSEYSGAPFRYCYLVRLLQQLTHHLCDDLGVLVVPVLLSIPLHPRVDTSYVKMPRQVVLIMLVVHVCACWECEKHHGHLLDVSDTPPPLEGLPLSAPSL